MQVVKKDLTTESLGLFRAKLDMSPTQSSANILKLLL